MDLHIQRARPDDFRVTQQGTFSYHYYPLGNLFSETNDGVTTHYPGPARLR